MAAKFKDIIARYNTAACLIVAILGIGAAIAKPMVWPDRIQADIQELQREDNRIKASIDSKADEVQVKADQMLMEQAISHVKEKVDKLETMVEFLYFRSGGEPLKGGD